VQLTWLARAGIRAARVVQEQPTHHDLGEVVDLELCGLSEQHWLAVYEGVDCPRVQGMGHHPRVCRRDRACRQDFGKRRHVAESLCQPHVGASDRSCHSCVMREPRPRVRHPVRHGRVASVELRRRRQDCRIDTRLDSYQRAEVLLQLRIFERVWIFIQQHLDRLDNRSSHRSPSHRSSGEGS
jgi:hypothetical protein